jgi:hypothetical protein
LYIQATIKIVNQSFFVGIDPIEASNRAWADNSRSIGSRASSTPSTSATPRSDPLTDAEAAWRKFSTKISKLTRGQFYVHNFLRFLPIHHFFAKFFGKNIKKIWSLMSKFSLGNFF